MIEPGESELNALARELHEELGVHITISSVSLLCRLTATPTGDPVHLSAWLLRDWRGTPASAAPEEHDDLGWFGLLEMPPLAHPVVRAALVRTMIDERL